MPATPPTAEPLVRAGHTAGPAAARRGGGLAHDAVPARAVVAGPAAGWVAADPGVRPNTTGLPGLPAVKEIVGAMLTFGLVACVAALVAAAVVWGLASTSGNPHLAGRGKTGVLVAAGAAMLIGAANAIVTFFSAAGARI